MKEHDATEQAYNNGYSAGYAEAQKLLEAKCRENLYTALHMVEMDAQINKLTAERNALLSDVSDYQGNICAFCKNFKCIAHRSFCEHFDNLPLEDGVPLMCGKWEWRGVNHDTE